MNLDEPIFIVGYPRSGTTMLASIFDRHSLLAVPPETRFFAEIAPRLCGKWLRFKETDSLINEALGNPRIEDLNLQKTELKDFLINKKSTHKELFVAILRAYAGKNGAKYIVEKSPIHLVYIPEIISWFPNSKIIIIIRDGRDAVLSLLKTPWARKNPLRHAAEWNYRMYLVEKYKQKYSKNISIVKYEELLMNPEPEVRRLCDFLDVGFESKQLQGDGHSSVVPDWEKEWKSKAAERMDPSRIETWKACQDIEKISTLTFLMKKYLCRWGYDFNSVQPLSFNAKIRLLFYFLPVYTLVRGFRETCKAVAAELNVEHWIIGKSYLKVKKPSDDNKEINNE